MIAIGTLKAFALIAEESQSSTYSMHRVVHLATQSWFKIRGALVTIQREALETVSEIVNTDFIDYAWNPKDNLLPHARLVATYETAEEASSCRAKLLSALASHDQACGDLESAHTAAVEGVNIYRSIKNTQNSAFLGSGSVLSRILIDRHEYREAEALNCELLSIGTKIGRMSYVIACQHAQSILSQEQYSEAEKLLRQLPDRATNLSDCTAGDRVGIFNDLAQVLARKKQYFEAEEIASQSMELVEDSVQGYWSKEAMGEVG